jgi:hypothetical protein
MIPSCFLGWPNAPGSQSVRYSTAPSKDLGHSGLTRHSISRSDVYCNIGNNLNVIVPIFEVQCQACHFRIGHFTLCRRSTRMTFMKIMMNPADIPTQMAQACLYSEGFSWIPIRAAHKLFAVRRYSIFNCTTGKKSNYTEESNHSFKV